MSQEHITMYFFKKRPQGMLIIGLLGVEALINFLDFFDSLSLLFYSFMALFLMIADIVVFWALYKIVKTPGEFTKQYSDDKTILAESLKKISSYCFKIVGAEVVWLLIAIIIGMGPGFYYWVTLFAPLISGIIAKSTAGTVETDVNFMQGLHAERQQSFNRYPAQQMGYQQPNPPPPQFPQQTQQVPPQYASPPEATYPQPTPPPQTSVQSDLENVICQSCGSSTKMSKFCMNCGAQIIAK